MVTFKEKGKLTKTEYFLKKNRKMNIRSVLEKYGRQGVAALSAATPKDTGFTAHSWSYEIVTTDRGVSLVWKNDHVEKGYANIAILLQYGHGTRHGGYVQGRDYINPAMRPIFDRIANEAWKEVNGK